MTDDLATRLITAADEFIEDPSHKSENAAPVLLRLAANEILRLRAELDRVMPVLNYLLDGN